MSVKANLLRSALALGACAVAVGGLSTPASARVVVGFGFGVPVVPAPWYYAPPPVVYAPPPVVYAPPQQAYVAQPNQGWYYCDNPRGYYPYVASCAAGWRQVPAQPNTAPPQH
ncbi:MAG TPA: hypothetical protein VHX19_21375 [Stellaceae bacterium]|nr:hypothetical protein [Stellaceae bacterium]